MNNQLATWQERRPYRDARQRSEIADVAAAHLPRINVGSSIDDADIEAMKAAFILRFDEDLPRTETLMAVANIGYRMALRDLLR